MRVLHVVNDVDTGGAQTLIEALMLASGEKESVHLLVLLGEGGLSSRLEAAAESVTYVRMSRRSLTPVRAMRALISLVREQQIEVVHSHLHQSDLVNVLTPHGRPRISTLHSSLDISSNPVARQVWRATAALSGRFDTVVACSASARDFARELGYRYDPDRMPIIHNGSRTAPSPSPYPGGEVLLHLARYAAPKDHPTLFRAFARITSRFPRAVLRCAGHNVNDQNTALTSLLLELGIRDRVSLLGSIDNVREEIRAATGVVFSSYHEALPMAGIEAIGEGTPIITTDIGDARVLTVSPEAVVPVRSDEALAQAMSWLLELPEEDQVRLRRRSWQLAVEEFDIELTVKRYLDLYRSAVPH
ncbi:glycosyltransferase [Kocuria arenosa]|uniref:glycosyltransferase n=1 Tax=Kocuria arenosa TaxID=3071446 RepID=UPI0034D537CA